MSWNGYGGAANAPRTTYGRHTAHSRALSRSASSGNGRWLRGVLVVFGVIAVAVGTWWWLSSEQPKPDDLETSKHETHTARRVKNNVAKSGFTNSPVAGVVETRESYASDTVSNGVSDAEAQTAADEEARREKWREKFARRRSIFTNGSDQILAMIASAPPGRDMPPLPITKSVDRDFIKSLETPIEILDGDSDEVRAAKEVVMKLRAEVLAIKESEGLSVYEILTQHQSLLRENAELRIEAQKVAVDIYRSGDVELAREYVDKANEKLLELGSEPIKMPGAENPELRRHIREKLESIRNRKNPQGRQ